MQIHLERIDENFLFQCTNASGNSILLDNTSREGAKGVSPMETVLMAVASCSGIDIVAILQKQKQEVTSFKAEVTGDREQVGSAKPFKAILVKFFLEGGVDPQKAYKAAQLSFDKYCSVSKTLEPNVTVNYEVHVNGAKVEESAVN
ncbi:OsmC family protein [Chryseobacterium sp. A301]